MIYWKFRGGNCPVVPMGGGTFFKVRGHKCTSKKLYKIFVVWIGNCDVTSIEMLRHYLHTIWRSKLHHFRQNYTTMKTNRWNSNRLLQGRPRSTASLVLITRFIVTECNRSTFGSLKFPFNFILAGIIGALWPGPAQDPFSTPPHSLWRYTIDRRRTFLQNFPPTPLGRRKQIHSLCTSKHYRLDLGKVHSSTTPPKKTLLRTVYFFIKLIY